MADQKISTMAELAAINSGDYVEVSEDDGAGGYNTKKYDLGDLATAESSAHTQNTDTGTTSTTFHIDSGNTGPKLKQDSGALYVRNSADGADAAVKAASFKTGTYTLTVDETVSLSDKAGSGANSDITSMTGLSDDGIPLAKVDGAAASGANSDITSMSGLTGDVTTSGNIIGGTSRVEVTGSSSLTDAQVRGTIVANYGMGSGGDTTLPAYSGSTMFTIITEAASQAWSLKPPSGEAFTLDGTALTADYEIDVGQTVGNALTLVRVRTGASSYAWHAFSIVGTHADGGAS